jgi:hypothetical protein
VEGQSVILPGESVKKHYREYCDSPQRVQFRHELPDQRLGDEILRLDFR